MTTALPILSRIAADLATTRQQDADPVGSARRRT